jgi:NADPH:quinone reductase-like Zn-dependent oxidoreductase
MDRRRRRIVIDRPGGYDRLKLVEDSLPAPGPGEVAIAVEAAGVNYADGIIRMGLYASAKELHGYPITPGFELAGTVLEVGEGVADLAPGERVMALTLFGGYTSRIHLERRRVFRIPPSLTVEQAATLPTVFLTAWFMVHQQLHPRRGERWLVHSAAGGVGQAVAQLGQLAGCEVIGVVGRADKVEAARAAGCHAVIDKSSGALWPRAESLAADGFDAIFDANGVATLADSYAHLKPTGRLLIYGFATMLPKDGRLNWLKLAWDWLRTPRFNPLTMTQQNKSVLACNLSFLSSEANRLMEGMDWLLSRFASGELQPLPVTAFDLADAARAQQLIESGRSVGKLVLRCG